MSEQHPEDLVRPEETRTSTTTGTSPTVTVRERLRFAPVDDPPATTADDAGGQEPDDGEPIPGPSPRTTAPTSRARQREIEQGMGRAIAGALVVVWIAARWALRGRGDLRRPTPEEYAGVADPIGRILARHAPVEFAPDLVMDIMDGSEAAGALALYLDPPAPPKEIRTA